MNALLALACALLGADTASLELPVELAPHAAGYIAWLEAHPRERAAETEWLKLAAIPDYYPLAVRLDEWLVKEPDAADAMDAYYEAVERDDALRQRVERFERASLDQRKLGDAWSDNQWLLRANPELAMRLFSGEVKPGESNDALEPLLRDGLQGALSSLFGAFDALNADPLAQTKAFPWWRQALILEQESGGLMSALSRHYAAHPTRFWVNHRRELALAEEVQARDWIRWWHRTLRRTPVDYAAYLKALSGRRWKDAAGGDAAEWPPKTAPPPIQPMSLDLLPPLPELRKGIHRPTADRPEVSRPEIQRPTRPERPTRPDPVQRPAAPERPEAAKP
ncbi:MAG: hypothetical protein GC168_10210 [Candidatus Hydrogenedens sp.]|nr:hypothetical protein [Candidatus Hydrogenedens sp.]